MNERNYEALLVYLAAGGGSIQKGAQKMYDTMKKLESRVS